MTKYYFAFFALLWMSSSYADALRFGEPLVVTNAPQGVFPHLDAGGRRALAIAEEVLAVTWEDNRDGKPAIYTAFLKSGRKAFSEAVRISGNSEAYESTIVALDSNRFVIGWEEAGAVWLRVVSDSKAGKAIQLDKHDSRQVSLARNSNGKLAAVWIKVQPEKKQGHVYYADFSVKDHSIQVEAPRLVDNSHDRTSQLHPVIALSAAGAVVAWEDRRHGHTRIFTALAPTGKPFQAYQLLNDILPSPNPEFGKGTGAMRPVLASDGNKLLAAAWMDKRNWRSGYDVYAAMSNNGGKSYGKNEQVQDMFAENIPQWHASVALRNKDNVAVVAWDDTRNETADIFYSVRTAGEWSEDYEMPGATGSGKQTHPSIEFDAQGLLHAVWLDNEDNRSRLMYIRSMP